MSDTGHPGHARELASGLAADYEAVFVLGGDGTAMEVIDALAGTGRPVGVLPGGTGNLIARSLGIPLELRRAVSALLRAEPARIDLGRLSTGRRFVFAAGVGVDSRMIEDTPAVLKRRIGVAAYLLTAAGAVLRQERFTVRVTVDGERHERDATMAAVTNFGTVLRELITLGPGIRRDDGRLDLCVFSPGTLRDAARICWRLLRRDFRPDPCMLHVAGRSFRVETFPPRAAQADGELIGDTPFEVNVEALAGCVLVPVRD